jgi:hypothetical protein
MEALLVILVLLLAAKLCPSFELLAMDEQFTIQEADPIVLLGSSGVEKGCLVQDDTFKVKRRSSKLIFNIKR